MSETIVPAGDMAYESDFYLWTQFQATALRHAAGIGANVRVDWENVAEEIESLGKSEESALQSRLRTIIEHLMKLEFSPADEPRRPWRETVTRARLDIGDQFERSPSLQRYRDDFIDRAHCGATKLVLLGMEEYGELDSARRVAILARRYSADEVLGDWFPAR